MFLEEAFMTQDSNLEGLKKTVMVSKSQEELQIGMQRVHDWTHMYHLADGRRNLIEWLSGDKKVSVLEVGSECGALTGMLSEKYGAVTALEISPEKAEIAKIRLADRENINWLIGGLEQIGEEKFDLIFSIGSLPLAEEYLKLSGESEKEKGEAGRDPYISMLKKLNGLLANGGRLILALPNKLGLKYMAGCREDYFSAPFTGIEDYYYHKGMRTFGRHELTGMMSEAGFEHADWYYPYPDYRFMNSLYTDAYLPREGELTTNLVNYDQERYVFFDEAKAFDTMIREGLFQEHANSFLLITGRAPVSDIIFSKYSAERDKKYALRTDIRNLSLLEDSFGDKLSEEQMTGSLNRITSQKTALRLEGKDHIEAIRDHYIRLQEQYLASGIKIGPCRPGDKDGNVILDFVSGQNLQRVMENLIIRGRETDLLRIIGNYTKRILMGANEVFEETEEFCQVFGDVKLPQGLKSSKVSDIDLIFSNIIIPTESAEDIEKITESTWSVIDYEWTFDFPIPVNFILYRCYDLACHQLMKCQALDLEKLTETLGMTQEEISAYRRMEENFQKTVCGKVKPERDLLLLIGNAIIPFAEMDRAYREEGQKNEELKSLKAEVATFGIRKAISNKFRK